MIRVRRTGARRIGLAAAVLLAVAGGCDTTQDGPRGGADSGEPVAAEVPRERIEVILTAHRERTAKLGRIHVSGAVAVEWPDAEGEWQSEQVSVRVWVDGARRTAARFLIGFPETDLFWFGSDDERAWLFDLASDETRLCSWRHDAAEPPTCADTVLPAIGRPLSTADILFGAVPLPATAIELAAVSADGERVSLIAMGRQEPVRLTWSVDSGRLTRVEVLDRFGEPWATADHSMPAPLAIGGLAQPLQPRLATRVVVRDRNGSFTARFNFDLENSASLDSQRWSTLFDLDLLRRVLRPDIVEGGAGAADDA